jgi:hypothetical protein
LIGAVLFFFSLTIFLSNVNLRHEHLYGCELLDNIIVSDDFPKDVVAASRLLSGCRVILCSLGMLCNPRLACFTLVVPIETIIIDEASQIECGDYIPLISMNARTLRKFVFIGDHQQCETRIHCICRRLTITHAVPPYGHEDLLSIFERAHLKKKFKFLDIQCMSEPTCPVTQVSLSYGPRSNATSNWGIYFGTGLQRSAKDGA